MASKELIALILLLPLALVLGPGGAAQPLLFPARPVLPLALLPAPVALLPTLVQIVPPRQTRVEL